MRQLSLSLRVLAKPHVFSPLQPCHSYRICFRCLEVGGCVGGSQGFLNPQERKPVLLTPLCPLCPSTMGYPSTFLHVRGMRAAPAGDAIPTHPGWCRLNPRAFTWQSTWRCALLWHQHVPVALLKEQPAHPHYKREAQIAIERWEKSTHYTLASPCLLLRVGLTLPFTLDFSSLINLLTSKGK